MTLQYPTFGSSITEMQFSSDTVSNYRYGFNNQEKDGELGDYYGFEYRMHDARLGKFLSVDPLSAKFSYYSPYQFAANQPIHAVELEGLESSEDLANSNEEQIGLSAQGSVPLTQGTVTYSNASMQLRIENATRKTNDIERGRIGRFFHKDDYKHVANSEYQPAIADVINNSKNNGISIYFTDNVSDIQPYIISGNQQPLGALIKKSNTNYIVFAATFNINITGTDPLFEEVFHLKNASDMNTDKYTQNTQGRWGIFNKADLDKEEALAKFQVVTLIHNIKEYNFESAYSDYDKMNRIHNYGYRRLTSFGAMLNKTQAEILIFITTNKGAMHGFDVYEYWNDPSSGNRIEVLRKNKPQKLDSLSQEGAYQ